MIRTAAPILGLALLTLIACRAQPASIPGPVAVTGHPEIFYLPEQRMRGTLVLGFEVFAFEGCWLEMTRSAAIQFRRLAPDTDSRGPHRFRVAMMARRTPPGTGQFGHLGTYPCQVQATRFLSVRRR